MACSSTASVALRRFPVVTCSLFAFCNIRFKHKFKLVRTIISMNPSARTIATSTNEGTTAKQPFNSWCCTASIASGSVQIDCVQGYDDSCPFRTASGKSFDLTSNSQWMEYLEAKEGIVEEGGAGAYDVFRCDLHCQMDDQLTSGGEKWRIWGQDFHLERLRNSYGSLLEERQRNLPETENQVELSQDEVEEACKETRSIIKALLLEAEVSQLMRKSAKETVDKKDDKMPGTLIQLVRLSLLWTPPPIKGADKSTNPEGTGKIKVRGHAGSRCHPILFYARPDPIVATVAISLHPHEASGNDVEVSEALPTRVRNPQSKIASWCRLRKPLEDPDTYKPPGVGEVLMVRPIQSKSEEPALEVLEGLTSNFFVVYSDGTLRTANDGVLYGYARSLVLECARRCGMTLDARPVLLEDAKSGLWKEAFITSSSRLIYPISRILMPHEDYKDTTNNTFVLPGGTSMHTHFTEFWADPVLTDKHHENGATPKWEMLLDEMLRYGGTQEKGEQL